IEENNHGVILHLIPSVISMYQRSNASVEEIKADLIGIYIASIRLIEKYKDEPFSEKEKNETISSFLKSASLAELLACLEESLLSLANSLEEMLVTEDIVSRIKRYTQDHFHQELSMTEQIGRAHV